MNALLSFNNSQVSSWCVLTTSSSGAKTLIYTYLLSAISPFVKVWAFANSCRGFNNMPIMNIIMQYLLWSGRLWERRRCPETFVKIFSALWIMHYIISLICLIGYSRLNGWDKYISRNRSNLTLNIIITKALPCICYYRLVVPIYF